MTKLALDNKGLSLNGFIQSEPSPFDCELHDTMEITKKITLAEFDKLLQENPSVLIYFYQDSCDVCKMLFTKVQELLSQEFPKMEMLVLEAEQNRALAAQLRMLSVPGIMVYFEGKEFFRSNGLVTIGELDHRLRRLYEMFF